MLSLDGKVLNNVKFSVNNDVLSAQVVNNGVKSTYEVAPTSFSKPCEAILMDLDGTTLTSEEFWISMIEQTIRGTMGDDKFQLEQADIPFVSGFTTVDHLQYCINKYCPDKNIHDSVRLYHQITEVELKEILAGRGRTSAFQPMEGLKDFLYEVKNRGIKIGLATSGLDYKAIPEIVAVFRQLDMGNPLEFYDAIITGGRRKDNGDYGTLGEIVSKPHPWIYTELAYMGLKIKDKDRVMGIEDSSAGVMALRFAGFPVIGLESGNITESGLNSLCYKKVNCLTEILKHI